MAWKDRLLEASLKKAEDATDLDLQNLEYPLGMTPLHLSLKATSFFDFYAVRKRRAHCLQFERILQNERLKAQWINSRDNQKNTPLHLAIRAGYNLLVKRLIEEGADITLTGQYGKTPLELAGENGKDEIYHDLLAAHCKRNIIAAEAEKEIKPEGYTKSQLVDANKIYLKNLQRRKYLMGSISALLAIACPIGSILAFYELPLLGILFSTLIPVVGPFIGLAAAVVFGGLMFWATYQKPALRYGMLGQSKADLEIKRAQLLRLEAEIKSLDKTIHNSNSDQTAQKESLEKRKIKTDELQELTKSISEVTLQPEAQFSDHASSKDVIKARFLTAASFLCSFSGLLAILGGITKLLPVMIVGTALLGIPVVGWIGIGVALGVGVAVAVWAYKNKFSPTLDEFGKVRQQIQLTSYNLHLKAITLEEDLGLKNKQDKEVEEISNLKPKQKIEKKGFIDVLWSYTKSERSMGETIKDLIRHRKKIHQSKNMTLDLVIEPEVQPDPMSTEPAAFRKD